MYRKPRHWMDALQTKLDARLAQASNNRYFSQRAQHMLDDAGRIQAQQQDSAQRSHARGVRPTRVSQHPFFLSQASVKKHT